MRWPAWWYLRRRPSHQHSLPFLGLGLSSIHADLAVHSTIAWSVLAVHHRVESTKELESGLMS